MIRQGQLCTVLPSKHLGLDPTADQWKGRKVLVERAYPSPLGDYVRVKDIASKVTVIFRCEDLEPIGEQS